MDFEKKLVEIRSKPEHVREKYLWIAMTISFIVVVGIWFFSFRMNIKNSPENKNDIQLKSSIEEAKKNIGGSSEEETLK